MSKKKIKRPQQYKRPQERTFKEWWQQQSVRTRKAILCGCIALAVVIALALVYYYGIYDDGSLKVSRGVIEGAQENWLIGERSSGKNSKYYHIADVTAPAGYTVRAESLSVSSGSSLRRDFSYEKATQEDTVTLFIAPVNTALTDMVAGVHEQFSRMTAQNGAITEVQDYADSALGGCKYFSYQQAFEGEEGTRYTQSLLLYAPCSYQDTCILVSVTVSPASAEGYWQEEALLSEALLGLEGIAPVAR